MNFVDGTAQIIFASLAGLALILASCTGLLKSLTGFLPVWREGRKGKRK